MKFPVVFSRFVGGAAGQPTLGGDLVPVCDKQPVLAGSGNSTAAQVGDNAYTCTRMNLAGWPPQRVAIACRYIGAVTPANVPVNVYIYDSASGGWFLMNSAPVNITPTVTTAQGVVPTSVGALVYFDIPVLMDKPPTQVNLGDANAMGVMVMVIPASTGNTLNNGEYRFIVAGDMSSSP